MESTKETDKKRAQHCDYGVRMEDLLPEGMTLEERQLDEMSFYPITAVSDGLPFKMVLMNPDAGAPQPHVHIYGRGREGKELGCIVITKDVPSCPEDLVPYEVGKHKGLKDIPPSWRQMIVDWARKKSYHDPLRTNWANLLREWNVHCYLHKTGL